MYTYKRNRLDTFCGVTQDGIQGGVMKHIMIMGAALVLAACNYDLSKVQNLGTDPVTPPAEDTYASINTEVIQVYCIRCHQGATPAGDALLTSYQAMIDSSYLVPGDPENSMVWTLMRDKEMPKRGAKVTDELIERVRVWIEKGAPET